MADPGPVPAGEAVEVGAEDVALVRAAPQRSDGNEVLVAAVTLGDTGGYVVAYADGGGAPGVQIGASELLPAGESTDVVVTLDEPLEETGVVHLMVHAEDNGNEQLDFPAHDAPFVIDTAVVVVAIEVEVT